MDSEAGFVGFRAVVRDAAWKELGDMSFVIAPSQVDAHILALLDALVCDTYRGKRRILGGVCFGQVATRKQVPDLLRANAERWNPHILPVPVSLWIE